MTCESAPGMRRDNAARSQQTPRKLKDRFDNGIDLVFRLGSKAGAARLVIVDHVIDLDDREPMDSKLQPLARAALRLRMWARYSSRVIVSAASRSTSAPRRWISASHAGAAPASGSPSRLRISSSARRARSSAGALGDGDYFVQHPRLAAKPAYADSR